MATTIRQMLINSNANPATVTLVIQKGIGPYPMPGVNRVDAAANVSGSGFSPGGVVVPNTDPLWDKRINSAFEMPRCIGYDTGIIYHPVAISQHEMYFHGIFTSATNYTTGNTPVHIITDLGFQPWRAYQGQVQGRLPQDRFPQ